jgi:hypothetical protein
MTDVLSETTRVFKSMTAVPFRFLEFPCVPTKKPAPRLVAVD